MALDYGKRKRVSCVSASGRQNVTTDVDTAFPANTAYRATERAVQGFILLDKTDRITQPEAHGSKCCCNKCRTVFDADITLTSPYGGYLDRNIHQGPCYFSQYKQTDDYRLSIKPDPTTGRPPEIECPECHERIKNVQFIAPTRSVRSVINSFSSTFIPTPSETNGLTTPVETDGWVLPNQFVLRQLIESRTDDGKLTRLDDSTLFSTTVISPEGKSDSYCVELRDSLDMLQHTRTYSKSLIRGGKRESTYFEKPVTDPYLYSSASRSDPYRIRTLSTIPTSYNTTGEFTQNYIRMYGNTPFVAAIQDNGDIEQLYDDEEFPDGQINEYVRDDGCNGEHFTDLKAKLIEQIFHNAESTQDPIMTDSKMTGLYLTEHKQDSKEGTTPTDGKFKDRIISMMTRYPCAYEYALERAHEHVIDYEMTQKRKEKAATENGEHYTAKTMTDKGKARFMRQELIYVADQLATMDNKLLKIIADSPNVTAMKVNLAHVAFGNQADSIKRIQGHEQEFISGGDVVHIDTDNAKNAPVKSKALVSKFHRDVFGITNTIYTAHKIGIHNIDNINELIEIGQSSIPKQLPDVPYADSSRRPSSTTNAGTIKPIESQRELQFMRSFSKTHNASDVIAIYRDPEQYDLYVECVRMFAEVKDKNTTIITEDNDATAKYSRQMQKNNLMSYLDHHSVTDAYVGYVTTYGAKTPQKINQLIAEIKLDKKMPEIQQCMREQGMDAALDMAKPYIEGVDPDVIRDPKTYIETWTDADEFAGKQIVSTRNGKDLFRGRSLLDIHEELSHINKHLVSENVPLTYPPELQAMEKSYPNPNGEGEWSFHCHKDSFDVVRSSTHLHNCLGSSFVSAMQRDSSYVMYMEDEKGTRVAAIELGRNNKRLEDGTPQWYVKQFQADHDTALPPAYAGVATQWLRESQIDYEHSSDVKAFGSGKAFYGNGDADFHHDEIDEISNTVVNKDVLAKREKERQEMAKRLFHFDETTGQYDFGVNVPDAP